MATTELNISIVVPVYQGEKSIEALVEEVGLGEWRDAEVGTLSFGQGRLLASMDYCGFRMGALAAMAALRHLDGLAVPREIMLPAECSVTGQAVYLRPERVARVVEV
mgnify:CR=1 FL=1